MAFTNQPIQTNRIVDFIRPLSAQSTNGAVLVPRVTGGDYDISRDTNDVDTKEGKLITTSSVTVEPKLEVVRTDSIENMYLTDALMNDTPIEHWHVSLDEKDSQGRYFAFYAVCKVTEDSQGGDPGEYATREFTLSPINGVTYGYTPLPEGITEEELNKLVFMGTNKVTSEAPTGGGVAKTATAMPTPSPVGGEEEEN